MSEHAEPGRHFVGAVEDELHSVAGERSGRAVSRRHVLTLAAVALAVGGCKILPIVSKEEAAAQKFNGTDYVSKVWATDVVPVMRDKAFPIEQVIDAIEGGLDKAGPEFGHRPAEEGSPWSFIVKGTATIKEKNTTSRAGVVLIEVATSKGAIPVTIQIGPVIKGNSLRDAMPFINFQNFTNQIEFAEVGRAFNARVLTELQPAIDALAAGQSVSFAGTFSMNSVSDKILLTPVLLGPAGGAK